MRSASVGRVVGSASRVGLLLFVAAAAPAQVDDEADTEAPVPIDEIVVVGNKDGDPVDVEPSYEEQLRARIVRDYLRQQALEDEERWRKSLPTAVEAGDGRIRWGYDARAESRVRRELALTDLTPDTTRPATVISIRF